MTYKATTFRQNLYAILDAVIDEGRVVEIERRGRRLRIVPDDRPSIWARLEPHSIAPGDPEDLVIGGWDRYWNQDQEL